MSKEPKFPAGNIAENKCANGEHVNGRWHPPSRRASETISFKWPPNAWKAPTYFVSCSKDESGNIYEIFVSSARPSNPMADVIRDASIIISILLQHSIHINMIRHSITRLNDNRAASIIGAALDLIAPPDDGAADVVSDPMLARPRYLDTTSYIRPSAKKAMVEAL